MNQDEIIEMAKQAGFPTNYNDTTLLHGKEIQSFAKLIVAKERDEILQMCNSAIEATKEAKKQLRKDEIFAHSVASGAIHQAERLTSAIRARGEA